MDESKKNENGENAGGFRLFALLRNECSQLPDEPPPPVVLSIGEFKRQQCAI
jgi:hypothetical protein